MYVHERARLIYLAHPRTASRATVAALGRQGFRHLGRGNHDTLRMGYAPERMGREHEKLRAALDRLLIHKEIGAWDIACTVRHHVDALASWACYLGAAFVPSFVDYLWDREPEYFPHADSLWRLHGDVAHTVLRFESLEDDVSAWLESRGLQFVRLDHVNVGEARQGRAWQEIASPEAVEYVCERFGVEMDALGYEADV